MERMLLKRNTGFTIVELMIALALGLTVSAAVLSIFVSSKRSYNDNTRISQLQDKGRSALFLVAHEVRHANFWGPLIDSDSLTSFPSGVLSGSCSNWAASTPSSERFVSSKDPANAAPFNSSCLTTSAIRAKTSAIAVKRVSSSSVDFSDSSFTSGEVFLRTDSTDGELLVKGLGSGNSAPGTGISDWIYEPHIYFIRDYWETAGDGIPSLCSVKLDDSSPTVMKTQCLVTGIEDLHFEFGFDRSGNGVPDVYIDSPTASEMEEVAAVQIYILVRDEETDPFYQNKRDYNLGSKTVTVNDNYRRALFTTTVIPQNQRTLPIKVPGS